LIDNQFDDGIFLYGKVNASHNISIQMGVTF